ncbi:MAG: hemerythrin domain-containing protein [Deltaproteobacteria bacterium]|nr:hemerythrin domain-containing protein [Deltaproteobacteria bacterium]
MAPSLAVVHDALHRLLEERVWRTLEALVTQDGARARCAFEEFATALDEHMGVEDLLVIPAWRPLAPRDGPGRVDHLEGDHVVLVRLVREISAFLPEPMDLRTTLQRLPSVYRLLGVLEHHTVREDAVYRALEERLASEDRATLTAAHLALVERLRDR